MFYMLQDIHALNVEVRKNVQTNIFTNDTEARAFFGTSSMGFGKNDKAEADIVINTLFKNVSEHKCLVYCRPGTAKHKWYYMIGHKRGLKLGCNQLREYCEQIESEKRTDAISKDSPFYNDLIR